MLETLSNPLFVAVVLVIIGLVWEVFLKNRLLGVLTPKLHQFISLLVDEGVAYAEQTYKETDGDADRWSLAVDYVYNALKKAGVLPDRYLDLIHAMIKSAVLNLPKTHNNDGSIAI